MVLENNRLYNFGPFRLNVAERLLFKKSASVHIGAKTFDLLLALIEAAGQLRTRDELIGKMWPDTIVEEHNLTTNVSALRKVLGDEEDVPRYIQTVRGKGYRFIAPVTIEELAPLQITRTPRRRRIRMGVGAACLIVALVVAGLFAWHLAPRSPAPATAHSIAVLPFENLSADESNDYFASGIQDTILTKLSSIGDLRVVSRTSTKEYSSHPRNLRKVGRQLGVSAVLEGSVQKAGDRVLINVQLIDVRTGNHIWAETYTRKLNNIFDVESDVAEQVASALKAKLLPAEAARLARTPTQNPQAYLLFLKANYLANRVAGRNSAQEPVAATAQAVELYRQALARDPLFALAYAHLSLLESYAYWYKLGTTSRRITVAEHAAKRALALEPHLPEAHLAMGYVDYYGDRDYAAALKQFKQALQALPNNADAIAAIAYILRRQGQWQKALTNFQRAAVLDPRNPRWSYVTGVTLMALRQYEQAIRHFNRALAVEPRDYYVMAFAARAWLLAGEPAQAFKTLEGIPRSSDPRGIISASRFTLAWLARKPAAALAALAHAPDWVETTNAVGLMPANLMRARVLASEGKASRAKQAYEKARKLLQAALRKQPDNPNLWSFLGLTEAGLGQETAAIHAGSHATKLLPVSKDAIDGPSYLATLAKIYAQLDKPDQAVGLLRRLFEIPAGLVVSVPLLKRDPAWDPIRHDPGFQALLQQYTREIPTPSGAAPVAGTVAGQGDIGRSRSRSTMQ